MRTASFDNFGHSTDPNDQRTNYRFSDLYIPGNDESPEELFRQVLGNYITSREELETIKEILIRNGWDEEAVIVQYYIDEIDETAESDDDYSWARVKIDLAQGHIGGAGFEQVPWGDYELSCWIDNGYVMLQLENNDVYPTMGYTSVPVAEFMNMSATEIDELLAGVASYGMTPVGDDEE